MRLISVVCGILLIAPKNVGATAAVRPALRHDEGADDGPSGATAEAEADVAIDARVASPAIERTNGEVQVPRLAASGQHRDLQVQFRCPGGNTPAPAWHPLTSAVAWPVGHCVYTSADCNSPPYATELACCKGAYAGQTSGHCLKQLPNPPTLSPTNAGGLNIWYPDYDTTWTEAGCSNARPKPSGRPEYGSMLACCKGAYGGQMSGKCLANLPNPPTTSPTSSSREVDFWYPMYEQTWATSGCSNKLPLPYKNINDRPNYKSQLACCNGAYGGQVSSACVCRLGADAPRECFVTKTTTITSTMELSDIPQPLPTVTTELDALIISVEARVKANLQAQLGLDSPIVGVTVKSIGGQSVLKSSSSRFMRNLVGRTSRRSLQDVVTVVSEVKVEISCHKNDRGSECEKEFDKTFLATSPSATPTVSPTTSPTPRPTTSPTNQPSMFPTQIPSTSIMPSPQPSGGSPSGQPSSLPSSQPSGGTPSGQPSIVPSSQPSGGSPSGSPSLSRVPSPVPTATPSDRPSETPVVSVTYTATTRINNLNMSVFDVAAFKKHIAPTLEPYLCPDDGTWKECNLAQNVTVVGSSVITATGVASEFPCKPVDRSECENGAIDAAKSNQNSLVSATKDGSFLANLVAQYSSGSGRLLTENEFVGSEIASTTSVPNMQTRSKEKGVMPSSDAVE